MLGRCLGGGRGGRGGDGGGERRDVGILKVVCAGGCLGGEWDGTEEGCLGVEAVTSGSFKLTVC